MSNDSLPDWASGEQVLRELLTLSPGDFRIYSRLAAISALGSDTIARGIDRVVHVAPDEHGPPVPLRTFPLADEGGRVLVLRPREEELT